MRELSWEKVLLGEGTLWLALYKTPHNSSTGHGHISEYCMVAQDSLSPKQAQGEP